MPMYMIRPSGLLVPVSKPPEVKRDIRQEMADYYAVHKCCPRCGSKHVEATCMSCLDLNGSPYRDTNRAKCSAVGGCGWIGIVDDLVPVKGE